MERNMQNDGKSDAKDLVISICNFLLEEQNDKTWKTKRQLCHAVHCLRKAYRIGLADCVFTNKTAPLREVFSFGCWPIKVKDRLRAEVRKERGNAFMTYDNTSFRSAAIEYSAAIRLNPRNAVYWCNRAASRIRLEFYTSAISDCERALQLDRSYTKALAWQGIAHAMTGHPGKAIRCYRRALRIEPENEVCIANMDVIYRNFNRTTFGILEPLSRFGRHLSLIAANLTSDQVLFKRLKASSDDNHQEEREKLRFINGTLD